MVNIQVHHEDKHFAQSNVSDNTTHRHTHTHTVPVNCCFCWQKGVSTSLWMVTKPTENSQCLSSRSEWWQMSSLFVAYLIWLWYNYLRHGKNRIPSNSTFFFFNLRGQSGRKSFCYKIMAVLRTYIILSVQKRRLICQEWFLLKQKSHISIQALQAKPSPITIQRASKSRHRIINPNQYISKHSLAVCTAR